MKPLYFLFGLLVGICAGAAVFIVSADALIAATVDYAALIALYLLALAVGAFGIFFLIRYIVVKRIGLSRTPAAGSLVDQVFQILRPKGEVTADERYLAAQQLVKGSVVWAVSSMGFFTLLNAIVAIVAVFAGTVASLLLFKQNELIEEQKKSDLLQAVLAESARRSLQYEFVGSLISRIGEAPIDGVGVQPLSPELVRDIERALNVVRPYAVAEFSSGRFGLDQDVQDSVEVRFLSSEKGRLLRALIENYVSVGETIGAVAFDGADFTFADYRDYLAPGNFSDFYHLDCSHAQFILEQDVWIGNPAEAGFYDLASPRFDDADFSRSVIANSTFRTGYRTRYFDTRFIGSYVSVTGVPTDELRLMRSILFLREDFDNTGLTVEMTDGGCIIYGDRAVPIDVFVDQAGVQLIKEDGWDTKFRLIGELIPAKDLSIPPITAFDPDEQIEEELVIEFDEEMIIIEE